MRLFIFAVTSFFLISTNSLAASVSDLVARIAEIQDEISQNADIYSPSDIDSILSKLNSVYELTKTPSLGDDEIAVACRNSFGDRSAGQKCASQAKSADAVRACRSNFGAGDAGLSCAIAAKNPYVVNECRNAGKVNI